MNWGIKNNRFTKKQFSANPLCVSIANSLKGFESMTFYLRGSMIEHETPHIKADIDLYVIHQKSYLSREIAMEIVTRLSYLNRFIDLHIFNQNEIKLDLPNSLLLYSRSIHILGPKIKFQPIVLDHDLIEMHWKTYNPNFSPDIMHSSVRSRVCALKNLTRCFGLISLIERKIFMRDIQECLDYAKTYDKAMHQNLIDNWDIVDFRKPLYLREVKEFLIRYHREYLIKTSP